MRRSTREGRPALLLVVFIVSLFALMAGQVRFGRWERLEGLALAGASPLLRLTDAVMRAGSELSSKATGSDSPASISRLRQDLAGMQLENQRLDEQRLENIRLRALLGLKESLPFHAEAASLISNSVRGSSKTCLINRGKSSGLRKDMAVVNSQGVVGRTWAVSGGITKVQLLVDAASGVAVLVQRTRVQGVLIGRGDALLELRYLTALDDVEPGDLLLTSGQDGIYPKGLPVGIVAEVVESSSLQRVVKVVPRVEFNRLEEVLVILPESGEDSSLEFQP
jgi:rod shape-determining protein MreC